MSKINIFPTLPLFIKDMQVGFPCRTYYYITDNNGYIWHRDGKWCKKPLIELNTYKFVDKIEAGFKLIQLTQAITVFKVQS